VKRQPLNLNDPVYVTKLAHNGLGYVERGFVTRIHDDYVEMWSIDGAGLVWAKRENVVTTEKMKQLQRKV